MLRKTALIGLLLLVAGLAASWRLVQDKKDEHRRASALRQKYSTQMTGCMEQYSRWLQLPEADKPQLPWGVDEHGQTKGKDQLTTEQQERLLADADRLAASEAGAGEFANVIYGPDWRQRLAEYKKNRERREFVFTAAVVVASVGAVTVGLCSIAILSQLIGRLASLFAKWRAGGYRIDIRTIWLRRKKKEQERQEQCLKPIVPQAGQAKTAGNSEKAAGAGQSKISQILKSGEPVSGPAEKQTAKVGQGGQLQNFTAAGSFNFNGAGPARLKGENQQLEKRIAEFIHTAQSIKQTVEESRPVNGVLRELAEQVSAIREYAASQQERVRKLQEGYDWNIIKNFCLRIIRCIDNIEDRISRLTAKGREGTSLEEVREELVFVLESSSIEQYEPAVNSDWHGQERSVEVMKDRHPNDDPQLSGKVAEVVRAGYRYHVDGENIKVIRAAQVKVYE